MIYKNLYILNVYQFDESFILLGNGLLPEQSVSSGLCEHADPGAHSLHFLTWRLSRTHLPRELDREPPNLNSSVLPSALKTFH